MIWLLLGVLIFAPIVYGFVEETRRRRARRRQALVGPTPAQRQEAFYKNWKPAIQKSKEPQEFYDVEKEGL